MDGLEDKVAQGRYEIEHVSPNSIAVTFYGFVPVSVRLRALDSLIGELRAGDVPGVMIDFSQADITKYGAGDALRLAETIARERASVDRVAYVLRPGQADMIANVLSSMHGNQLVRRFEDRASGLSWLATLLP